MIEHEVLKLQIISTVKLLIAAFVFFIWLPRKVFPQDYIDNSLDKTMFNIIHMVALITLLFPLFIYIRVFGLLFIILFFLALKLLFVKFYYGRNLSEYFNTLYLKGLSDTLKVIERPLVYRRLYKQKVLSAIGAYRNRVRPEDWLLFGLLSILVVYSFHILLYRGYVSLVSPVPDMAQFYYWNNMLKINTLFSPVAGAPYMWGCPVLIYTVNLLANLDAVIIHNIFPLAYLSFLFFSIVYFAKRIFEGTGTATSSFLIMLVLLAVVLPSPLASKFFGLVFATENPDVIRVPFLSLYSSQNIGVGDHLKEFMPFYFYWKLVSSLPYEIAAGFFIVNIFFLVKYIESKNAVYALLYGETLAIVFAVHGGVAIALFLPSLLIFLFSLASLKFSLRSLGTLAATVLIATVIGNVWTLQFLIYGLPDDIGAAAPILDKLLQTKREFREIAATSIYAVQLVRPTILLLALGVSAVLVFVFGLLSPDSRFRIVSVSFVAIGILVLYFQQNIGLPKLVDHSRLQIFLTISYAIIFGSLYHLVIERHFLPLLFRHRSQIVSVVVAGSVVILSIAATPRWIDTEEFWRKAYTIEHKEFPFLTYRISNEFQSFTFTIVSYVQQFPQVVSSGYHINTQEFLQQFSPVSKRLDIETDYIFIFSENIPKEYEGLGEYWYRWRRDIMLKLKDWIAIYSQTHDNIKLYYKSRDVEVYVVTNRSHEDLLERQRREMRTTHR